MGSPDESYDELSIELEGILSRLEFGVEADRFEEALDELAEALGFNAERPDKEWKEGPDNLWATQEGEYLLIECKNEVKLDRGRINKGEGEQVGSSCAWFEQHYAGSTARPVLIHPSHKLGKATAFTRDDVEIMRKQELNRWKSRIEDFFSEFSSTDLTNFDDKRIQAQLVAHKLDVDHLMEDCTKAPFYVGREPRM